MIAFSLHYDDCLKEAVRSHFPSGLAAYAAWVRMERKMKDHPCAFEKSFM